MTIGDWQLTVGIAVLAGFISLVVLMIAVLISLSRGRTQQIEEAANAAADALRTNFVQQLADRDSRIHSLDMQLQQHRQENTKLQSEISGQKAKMIEQQRHNEENLARLQNARQQMTDEFKLISGDMLKSQSETFSKQNREQVDNLLKPLSDKIGEFQTGLIKDRAAMGENIRALSENSMRMATEATNLTRALKGNSQTQGAWGEMILSTILERSGLVEGEQFLTQQSHSADGNRLRTDVEVLMPNDDRMVIDSKVSLTAFEAYMNCDEEEERGRYLQAHVASTRTHIKTLGDKNYQRHAGSGLDYVMMFVPIEAAFSTAMTADPSLIDFAITQGVMPTTPTTLMAVLRTVRNVWDIEKRHQNAEEIAERAGSLYDKVAGFLGNMDKLGANISKAQQSFEEAKSQLTSGRGNVLRQVEMLRELGAKTSKQLPSGWDAQSEAAPVKKITSDQEPLDL